MKDKYKDGLDQQFLTGQLLIAVPSMRSDSFFSRAIIYILSHTKNGAIGIIINNVANNLNCSFILNAFNITDYKANIENMPVHFGGPIDSEKGFILHSCDYIKDTLFKLNNQIAVSSNLEILKDIALGSGPKKSIFALGYSGWDMGQLEEEIKMNNWLSIPFSEDIVFSEDNSLKWIKAMQKLGVDPYRFSSYPGNS